VPATAQTAQVRPISGTRLDVMATGVVTRVPDIADVDTGISTEAPTASEAIRGNGEAMDRLREALRRSGIDPRDIQTVHVDLTTVYRRPENAPPVFVGYRATHRLSIRFRDIANAGRILDRLVDAGAQDIDGLSYHIDATEAMREEARTLALAEARGRADRYARDLGMRVARILAISETQASGSSSYARVAAQPRYAEMSNTAFGVESTVHTVTVTFELE
jgi:uncharacterized protein YggE